MQSCNRIRTLTFALLSVTETELKRLSILIIICTNLAQWNTIFRYDWSTITEKIHACRVAALASYQTKVNLVFSWESQNPLYWIGFRVFSWDIHCLFNVWQYSASAADYVYISISTPILSLAFLLSSRLSRYTMEMVKGINPNVVDVVDPPKEGYQLTLRLDFTRIPTGKG